jgi:hypothetical protein
MINVLELAGMVFSVIIGVGILFLTIQTIITIYETNHKVDKILKATKNTKRGK